MAGSQLKAARIAAVAAVVAALISATSGISTYVVSQNQIQADDKRSSVEFLRTQSQEASVAFMLEHHALGKAEVDHYVAFSRLTESRSEADVTTREGALQRLNDAFQKFETAYVKLKLVASEELVRAAGEMYELHSALRMFANSNEGMPRTADEGYNVKAYQDTWVERSKRLDGVYDNTFVPTARLDLAGR